MSKYITLYEETSKPYPNGSDRLAGPTPRRFKEESILPILEDWGFESIEVFKGHYDDSHVGWLRVHVGVA